MLMDRIFFKENGYYIVKNVFSENEISDFRDLAYKALDLVKKTIL